MRRNVRHQHYICENGQQDGLDDMFTRSAASDDNDMDMVQLTNRASNGHAKLPRFENTLEVKVQEGDTLQALALRFHCSVADIKRLNKIDRENEIHAHRIIRIPVTVHNVLLGTSDADALPAVHRSGNNSPRHNVEREPAIERNPLEDARLMLDERLLVASVNASGIVTGENMQTKIDRRNFLEENANEERSLEDNSALLDTPYLRRIPGPSLSTIDWSGSDCDMSWICLLIFILALCVVIPLVYVIYLAEHPHHNHHST